MAIFEYNNILYKGGVLPIIARSRESAQTDRCSYLIGFAVFQSQPIRAMRRSFVSSIRCPKCWITSLESGGLEALGR